MKLKLLVFALVLLVLSTLTLLVVRAQTGGIRREPGFYLTRGLFQTFTTGEAISAGNAVYLKTSDGKIYKAATSGSETLLIGIAEFACITGQTTCLIQTWGKANAIADAAVAVNDPIGSPANTAGRLGPVAPTFTNGSGGTAVVMGSTDPDVHPVSTTYIGRALTAQANAGGTFTVLLGAR